MLLQADIGFIAEPLNAFRVHERTVRSTVNRQRQMSEAARGQHYICQRVPVRFTTRTRAVLELSKYFFQRPERPQPGEFTLQGFFRLMRAVSRIHGYFGAAIFGGIGALSLSIITYVPSFVHTLQKAYKQFYT